MEMDFRLHCVSDEKGELLMFGFWSALSDATALVLPPVVSKLRLSLENRVLLYDSNF